MRAPKTRGGRLIWAWCRGVFTRLEVAKIRRYLRSRARQGARRAFLAGPFPGSRDGRIDSGGGDLSIELPSHAAGWHRFQELATIAHASGAMLDLS